MTRCETTAIAEEKADRDWLRSLSIVSGVIAILDLLAIAVQWSVP